MAKKVFCEDCKFHSVEGSMGYEDDECSAGSKMVATPAYRKMETGGYKCRVQNKNNDCALFQHSAFKSLGRVFWSMLGC